MNQLERKLQRELEICGQEIEDDTRSSGILAPMLRFGRNRIVVSDIEQAYFCEKKLDFDYGVEEEREYLLEVDREVLDEAISIVGKEQDKGLLGHETVALTLGYIEELFVRMVYEGSRKCLVAGCIDEVMVNDSRIVTVERKFREIAAIPMRDPYLEHMTQARIYCLCLSYMLSRCQSSSLWFGMPMYYTIDYFPKACSGCPCFLNSGCDVCPGKQFFKSYSYPFTVDQSLKAMRELDFVAGYWFNQRDAKPTKYPNKCMKCEYRTICQFSLARR